MCPETFCPVNEKNYTEKLTCSKTTKKLIMVDCKAEFLKYHPEIKGMLLTSGFMLKKIAEYYIKDEF